MRTVALVLCLVALGCTRPPGRTTASRTTIPPTPTVLPTPATTPAPTVEAPAVPSSPAAPTVWHALAHRLDLPGPEAIAARLTDAESAIRSDMTSAATLEARAREQQAAYRQLAANPAWLQPVIGRVPSELRSIVRDNAEAAAELRRLTAPRPSLPPWRIVAPPAPGELLAHYRDAESAHGVPWRYLGAIHLVETRMGRIRGTSIAGARGPMQFMPATWDAYGEGDIESPRDSIRAAAKYLEANGAPGDMDRALYAYNRSNRYVRAIRLYAGVMERDERAYRAYHHWQVYYRTTSGDALLEEGYPVEPAP